MVNRRKLNDFLNSLKGIPPRVQNKKPVVNNSLLNEEMAMELFVEDVKVKRKNMKDTAYELWRLLEDIERASERVKVEDEAGYRSLVNQLTEKRFLYINEEEIKSIEAERVVRKEGENDGQFGQDGTENN